MTGVPAENKLSYQTPLPVQRPFAEEIGQDGHRIEPSHLLRGLAFFEIGLHQR
jgi:hypothetical protein